MLYEVITGLLEYCKNNATNQLDYWKDVLSSDFRFPRDKEELDSSHGNIESIEVELESGKTHDLLFKTRTAFGTEPYELT